MIEIELGKKYQDVVTGFQGVATGHCAYLSGCNQTLLVPPVGKDGRSVDAQWFDDQRLKSMHGKAIVLDNSRTPGFDVQAPKR